VWNIQTYLYKRDVLGEWYHPIKKRTDGYVIYTGTNKKKSRGKKYVTHQHYTHTLYICKIHKLLVEIAVKLIYTREEGVDDVYLNI